LGPAQNSNGWTTGAEDLKRDELTFLQQGQDLGRLSKHAPAGEDSMNAHVDDDNVVRVIDFS
jgi:hypothetical protein